MSEMERYLNSMIFLLQREVECLRSVLSEWDHEKSCYVQMNRADIFRQTIETMEYRLHSTGESST